MKILYVTRPSFADCDFPLIKAFQQKGIDITVLFMLAPYSLRSTLFNINKQINKTAILPAISYPEIAWFGKYLNLDKVLVMNRIRSTRFSYSYLLETILLRRFIKNGNFDIVHFVEVFNIKRSGLYRLKKVLVSTVHDPVLHSDEKNYEKENRFRKAVLPLYNGFVLLNQNQKQSFTDYYGLFNKPILDNRLGVYECMRLFPTDQINRDPYNILFFGNIRPYKGLEYLCEAMKRVCKEIPRATLTIAGSGSFYFDISSYMKEAAIEIENRFITTSELATYLAKCSLCVCPYTDATQSGVIMTAFSMGVPVVATNVGGLSEMITHNENGILVPPKDSKALSEAIISILNNQERLSSFSNSIERDYYHGSKSWDSICDKYITFYQQLIK